MSGKSWDAMSVEERHERARVLTSIWLNGAVEESPLTVLASAAAVILVVLKHAPEDARPALRLLLTELFDDEPVLADMDLDNVLLN